MPWAILIDPTGRCNLRCKGCWAAEYDRSQDMDYETLDRVMTEAEDIGVNFFVISGGEPTVRMDDLISLANKHNESMFHVFSNGTLITKERACLLYTSRSFHRRWKTAFIKRGVK